MKKIGIIGASYLQEPLIRKAKSMGLETHVFAWAAGDVGESTADFFYPISIVEKQQILEKCREIEIDGICSIASDLASITVNYVASEMGLVGNSMECSYISTNKHAMRQAFWEHGDPSPKSYRVKSILDLNDVELKYPIIVKPLDRSGSRGITKLESVEGLQAAIERAKEQGFQKYALVEEFADGQEYSVECVSWQGEHLFLALTKKFTTGSPHFIETAHLEPAPVSLEVLEMVRTVTFHALDSLKIKNGASHTELKIAENGSIMLIEVACRMGGDLIGSDLVELSTGFDFVKAVIEIALGKEPEFCKKDSRAAAVRFVFSQDDIAVLEKLEKEKPEYLIKKDVVEDCSGEVTDSSTRFGYFLMCAENEDKLLPYISF